MNALFVLVLLLAITLAAPPAGILCLGIYMAYAGHRLRTRPRRKPGWSR